ncbi:MAG: helix-turn-helix domain-containing protein [Burkholderiales bacterium]|nr:helix-turn-helix domain-containing protein [Burkholderiales bacterium]MCP5251562.1 helix-turn-helix domain-containing protein [Burkholderiales bacterium]
MFNTDVRKFMEPNDTLLNSKQAAEYLSVGVDTLSVWRCVGRYSIPFIKVGRLVRYRKSDLDAFLTRRTRGQAEV